jgi:predicted TIM-barrel fold metal-dependent hydrolase
MIIYDKEADKNQPQKIMVIDTHTHLGKEEVVDGHGKAFRIIRPRDHLDLYEKLKYDIYKKITEFTDEYAYALPKDVEDFAKPTTQLQKLIYSNRRTTQNIGWLADKIITFPLHGVLRTKTTPNFSKSNDYILSRAQTLEYGSRLVPYCRVDPTEGERAIKELLRSIAYGARGLKLHPLSEEWLEEIVTNDTIEIVRIAADHKLPVIFDCQNYQTAQEIHQVAMEVRDQTKNNDFTVIIGHFGFDYQTPGMFEILSDPNIKTETSGMHSGDCKVFYKNCINLVEDWHLETMYGTDHNYFGTIQASDHIRFLLSNEAKDLGITLQQIKHVLGLNALRILKLYWPEKIMNRSGVKRSKIDPSALDRLVTTEDYKEFANKVGDLGEISGVFYNIDSLLNDEKTKIYDRLYILNIFADIVNIRRSFVVQEKQETNNLKLSEITKLMDFASQIPQIFDDREEEFPFTKKYLFDYITSQLS